MNGIDSISAFNEVDKLFDDCQRGVNAQGEMQGGISSIMSIAMLLGTIFFSQIFGYFMQDGGAIQSPNMAYYAAGTILAVTLALFVVVRGRVGTES